MQVYQVYSTYQALGKHQKSGNMTQGALRSLGISMICCVNLYHRWYTLTQVILIILGGLCCVHTIPWKTYKEHENSAVHYCFLSVHIFDEYTHRFVECYQIYLVKSISFKKSFNFLLNLAVHKKQTCTLVLDIQRGTTSEIQQTLQ